MLKLLFYEISRQKKYEGWVAQIRSPKSLDSNLKLLSPTLNQTLHLFKHGAAIGPNMDQVFDAKRRRVVRGEKSWREARCEGYGCKVFMLLSLLSYKQPKVGC